MSEPMLNGVDLSALVSSLDANYSDSIPMDEWVRGIRATGSMTITGTWDDEQRPFIYDIALRLVPGSRLPRKSKKAIKKLWTGGIGLSAREMTRIGRITFQVER